MSNVPSQTLAALCGSRISAAHFPHGLCLTPLYLLFLSPVSSNETDSVLDGVVGTAVVTETVAVVGAVENFVLSSVTVALAPPDGESDCVPL